MTKSNPDRHLAPHQLIDLLDEAPVDAAVKLHVGACRRCAEELQVLRETLSQLHPLKKDDVPLPGENYWQEFSASLQGKLGRTTTARKSAPWYWYVAAAVTLAFLSWQIVSFVGPEPPDPVSSEAVLPAVEEDAEFLFLLSVVELSDSTEELEESLGWGSASDLDLSQLTSEEAEQFRRELEEELGDEHAKS